MSNSPPAVRTASVLIIEDNPDTADSLARFLRVGCGYDVRIAHDGEKGVKLALANPPDAIVCDIGLPRKNGFKVARELTDAMPVTPLLIAVTAYSGVYPEAQAAEAGFQHYFVKPASPFEIEALIEARLQRSDDVADGD
ncbi:MAG TPA: response regulator [Gemmataceae bacterium]|nr:response regulator [Gemmataceae bacterium]